MSPIPLLTYLRIVSLDLSREHVLIYQVVASSSFITHLVLSGSTTQGAAQLGRFITSFPSLRTLSLDGWSLSPSGLHDTGVRRSSSKSSIKIMHLNLGPNISGLLRYFARAHPFITHLEDLQLWWKYTQDTEQNMLLLQGVNEMFQQCSQHLFHLRISIDDDETSRELLTDSVNLCE